MKALAFGLVAAAALTLAVPASAQVRVYGSEDGVAVRVGPGHRHYDRGHHYGWRRHHADCRTVTVRKRMANGTVVVRKSRSC